MKLILNKKKLKNLSKDNKTVPAEMTPLVGGGARRETNHGDDQCVPSHGGRTC